MFTQFWPRGVDHLCLREIMQLDHTSFCDLSICGDTFIRRNPMVANSIFLHECVGANSQIR